MLTWVEGNYRKPALQGGQCIRVMGMEACSPQELYIKSAKPKLRGLAPQLLPFLLKKH